MSGRIGVGQNGHSGKLQAYAPLFGVAALVLGAPAHAQAPSRVTPRDVRPPVQAPTAAPYAVKGFRSARFGMDEVAVRAAAAKDFGVAPGELKREVSLADGATGLILKVASLPPGPGAATVQYILGAKSGTLVRVNVIWEAPAAAPETEHQKLIGASLPLTRYCRGFGWAPRKRSRPCRPAPTA